MSLKGKLLNESGSPESNNKKQPGRPTPDSKGLLFLSGMVSPEKSRVPLQAGGGESVQ